MKMENSVSRRSGINPSFFAFLPTSSEKGMGAFKQPALQSVLAQQ
jgi:hypothetical protein